MWKIDPDKQIHMFIGRAVLLSEASGRIYFQFIDVPAEGNTELEELFPQRVEF
jgi:hypothetical protein